jgi:hypothetical protein
LILLPKNATTASIRRAELAHKLMQSCPSTLGDEIALVGSTARGIADDESDLELNLWTQVIPPLDARIEWLTAAGAIDIHVEPQPRPDQSHWIGFRLEDVPCEIGWQTLDALKKSLRLILSGGMMDRSVLVFADILATAIPLRTGGQLAEWQTKLHAYPDQLQRGLILAAVERWSQPSSAHRLARRGESLALMEHLLGDLDAALRVIYAVNRHWEPSRKWTLTVAREFAPEWVERIHSILSDPSLQRRAALCATFCLQVLALVPEEYDVSAAVENLRASLES